MFNKIYYQELYHWIMQFKSRISHHGYRGVARFLIAVGLFLTRKSLSRHPAPMVQASRRFRAHASLVKVFLQKFFFTETPKTPFSAFLRLECVKTKYTLIFTITLEQRTKVFIIQYSLSKKWPFCVS